ncbi:MAG: lysylphosphatidylglycerol synthase transmembrane domain-containing protein [Methanomicrobiales archaeon]|nr:lysylphosphatidylglycerol synthase transmembrane domain-containing protein [Methanomicrobiales archaeon]MDI6875830.1 lysylphosphatidylglycerol synthase transmembrane domain-containing protein [Methanomicrobiales archaeon]
MYRNVSAIILSTLIALGIIGYMLFRVWDQLLLTLEHAVPLYLVVAVAICLCAWLLRGMRYRSILRGLEVYVDLVFSTASIFISQTANLIVPARLGDLVRIFILKHEEKATYSRGVSSLLVERVFDILMVAVLGIVALPFALDVPPWFYTVLIVPLLGGGAFFIGLVLLGRFEAKHRFLVLLLEMLDQVREASLNLRSFLSFGTSSILIWILDVLVCYAVVLMFQESIPFVVVVLAIVIGNLVKAVPITPGGVGTYEASLAATFVLAGTPEPTAILIAVVDHLIKNAVTLVGGVGSIYLFGGWALSVLRNAVTKRLRREDLFGD